ncbi:MAG: YncE family protein [Bacteroidota bacterium]|nr:YncE family protein [Bacteroidota bacterium]
MQTIIFLSALFSCFNCTSPGNNSYDQSKLLTLSKKITLAGVSGRMDHIAYDAEDHLAFIAALGNNTIEVVNINTGNTIHTIKGLHEPQGVAYIPSLKRLVVANGGNGKCIFYDTRTYSPLRVIDLKDDADNIRYDPVSNRVYAGYGNGGIAVIDANTMEQAGTISLDGHPESFQVSNKQNRIYINVPDENETEVADLLLNTIIAKWKNTDASSNFPMALNEEDNSLFIGCRSPATLEVVNTETGKVVYAASCSGDADDVFYNSSDSLVFVSAGKGFIDVFKTNSQKGLVSVDHLKTSYGARTSLLLPAEKKFLLAVPAHAGEPAALWIYTIM